MVGDRLPSVALRRPVCRDKHHRTLYHRGCLHVVSFIRHSCSMLFPASFSAHQPDKRTNCCRHRNDNNCKACSAFRTDRRSGSIPLLVRRKCLRQLNFFARQTLRSLHGDTSHDWKVSAAPWTSPLLPQRNQVVRSAGLLPSVNECEMSDANPSEMPGPLVGIAWRSNDTCGTDHPALTVNVETPY
jgi:hypothetical protein